MRSKKSKRDLKKYDLEEAERIDKCLAEAKSFMLKIRKLSEDLEKESRKGKKSKTSKVLLTEGDEHIKLFEFDDMTPTVKRAFNLVMPDVGEGEVVDWNLGADPMNKYSRKIDDWLCRYGADYDNDMFVRIKY